MKIVLAWTAVSALLCSFRCRRILPKAGTGSTAAASVSSKGEVAPVCGTLADTDRLNEAIRNCGGGEWVLDKKKRGSAGITEYSDGTVRAAVAPCACAADEPEVQRSWYCKNWKVICVHLAFLSVLYWDCEWRAEEKEAEDARAPSVLRSFRMAVAILRHQPSLEAIREIVEGEPLVMRFQRGCGEFLHWGWSLLHYAAAYSAPEDVVSYLVDQNPGALKLRTIHGAVPLHVAAQSRASLGTATVLTSRWRGALLAKTRKGETPLYLAAANATAADVVLVQALAMAEPAALRGATIDGHLPLHAAAFSRAPLPAVRILTHLWPEALQARANDGKVPLHLAAQKAERSVVQFLLDMNPEAHQARTLLGELPLHCAASDNTADVVQFLANRNPADLRATTSEGLLALHAASRTNSVGVVQVLLNRHPVAVRIATAKGQFPLHFAANSANLASVRLLADAYPEALQERDNEGLLPLQVASQAYDNDPITDVQRLGVIYELARMCPEAISGTEPQKR